MDVFCQKPLIKYHSSNFWIKFVRLHLKNWKKILVVSVMIIYTSHANLPVLQVGCFPLKKHQLFSAITCMCAELCLDWKRENKQANKRIQQWHNCIYTLSATRVNPRAAREQLSPKRRSAVSSTQLKCFWIKHAWHDSKYLPSNKTRRAAELFHTNNNSIVGADPSIINEQRRSTREWISEKAVWARNDITN